MILKELNQRKKDRFRLILYETYDREKKIGVYLPMVYLFISSFENDTSWIRVPGVDICVIEVGMAVRTRKLVSDRKEKVLYDDEGENISSENPYFGELTGLYWLWKHLELPDDEVIGFCHYSKYLDISCSAVVKFVQKHPLDGWVVLNPGPICAHRFPKDMEVLADILSQLSDERYINAWHHLYNADGSSKNHTANCHSGQLFYTTIRQFKKYCEFLFEVLFKAREVLGEVDRVPYHKRYCAFFGERLLSVWLYANNACVKPANIRYDENRLVYTCRKMARVLKIDKNTKLKKIVRKILRKTGDGSSWSRQYQS